MVKIFEKGELKLLWPFYLDAVLPYLLFFAPAFLVPYFIKLGFSFYQIGTLMAVLPLAALLFEIPTGAFADVYGRKLSTLFGFAIEGICLLLVYFVQDYYSLLIIFFIWGVGVTFSSGASDAWKTDLIKKRNKHLLKGYFIKWQILGSCGLFISGFLGALFVSLFGIRSIWLFGSVSFLITIIILSFGEEYFVKEKKTTHYNAIVKKTKDSIGYSYHHPVLSYFLMAIFIYAFALTFNSGITWTPLLQGYGFPDYAFGYLWSFMAAVGIFAPMIAQKLLKSYKEKRILIILSVLLVVSAMSALFVSGIISAFIVLFFCSLFMQAKSPILQIYFQKHLPTKMRATIGSVQGMILEISAILSPIAIGFILGLVGAKVTIFIGGLLVIPTIILYLKIKEKKK